MDIGGMKHWLIPEQKDPPEHLWEPALGSVWEEPEEAWVKGEGSWEGGGSLTIHPRKTAPKQSLHSQICLLFIVRAKLHQSNLYL